VIDIRYIGLFIHLNNLNRFLTSMRQDRLNSIIGPWAKQYTGALAYTATRRNNNVNGR